MTGPCKHEHPAIMQRLFEGVIYGRCPECGQRIEVMADGSQRAVAEVFHGGALAESLMPSTVRGTPSEVTQHDTPKVA